MTERRIGALLVLLGLALPLATFPFSEPPCREGARAGVVEQIRRSELGGTCPAAPAPMTKLPGERRTIHDLIGDEMPSQPGRLPFRYLLTWGVISLAVWAWLVFVSREGSRS